MTHIYVYIIIVVQGFAPPFVQLWGIAEAPIPMTAADMVADCLGASAGTTSVW